jgi:hypothetical protein
MERLPGQEPCGCDAGRDECERSPQPRKIRPFVRELELHFWTALFAHVRTPLSRCGEPSACHLTDLATLTATALQFPLDGVKGKEPRGRFAGLLR